MAKNDELTPEDFCKFYHNGDGLGVVGSKVELLGEYTDGFLGAYFDCRILGLKSRQLIVECVDFYELDGQLCQVVIQLPTKRVRPALPPDAYVRPVSRYRIGDMVDIRVDDLWWYGVVVPETKPTNRAVSVMLPYYDGMDAGPYIITNKNNIRPGKEWNPRTFSWSPRRDTGQDLIWTAFWEWARNLTPEQFPQSFQSESSQITTPSSIQTRAASTLKKRAQEKRINQRKSNRLLRSSSHSSIQTRDVNSTQNAQTKSVNRGISKKVNIKDSVLPHVGRKQTAKEKKIKTSQQQQATRRSQRRVDTKKKVDAKKIKDCKEGPRRNKNSGRRKDPLKDIAKPLKNTAYQQQAYYYPSDSWYQDILGSYIFASPTQDIDIYGFPSTEALNFSSKLQSFENSYNNSGNILEADFGQFMNSGCNTDNSDSNLNIILNQLSDSTQPWQQQQQQQQQQSQYQYQNGNGIGASIGNNYDHNFFTQQFFSQQQGYQQIVPQQLPQYLRTQDTLSVLDFDKFMLEWNSDTDNELFNYTRSQNANSL